MTPGVLILTGQTAAGKSALALALAERFGAEIVGADSRQIYRGMRIGTAAPSEADRARVPHHLIGFADPHERYSAARFVADALHAIDDIHARGMRAIVAGGTGFYIRALAGDVTLSPVRDEVLRERLAREARVHPPDVLADWLGAIAPQRAAAIGSNDPYRVTRALEIALAQRDAAKRHDARERRTETADSGATGQNGGAESSHLLTSAIGDDLRARGIVSRKLYLEIEPDALLERIERRVDAMLADGLLDEAERIGDDAVAANAVGYGEALAYLRGLSAYAELRAHLVRNTRRYAKRQATWFRSEPGLLRIPAGDAFVRASAEAGALPGWA